MAPGTHIFCYGEGLHESVVRIFKSKVSEVEDRTSPGSVSGKKELQLCLDAGSLPGIFGIAH